MGFIEIGEAKLFANTFDWDCHNFGFRCYLCLTDYVEYKKKCFSHGTNKFILGAKPKTMRFSDISVPFFALK